MTKDGGAQHTVNQTFKSNTCCSSAAGIYIKTLAVNNLPDTIKITEEFYNFAV